MPQNPNGRPPQPIPAHLRATSAVKVVLDSSDISAAGEGSRDTVHEFKFVAGIQVDEGHTLVLGNQAGNPIFLAPFGRVKSVVFLDNDVKAEQPSGIVVTGNFPAPGPKLVQ